ncbi:MAG: ferredoxin, partial [Deltaproteobacteria bacterium]
MADKINIALDIGTTTIACAAVDPATGIILSEHSAENPQKMWGMDLITRLNALIEDPSLLKEFSRATIDVCNKLIEEVSSGREAGEIAVAGNTVMEHIFLGISPQGMAKVPYKPAFKEAKRLKAKDVGLKAGPDALLYVFPII